MTLINVFFFLIALIYSSAGFGGGSMYLALLSQFPYADGFVRFTGLICNATVTATGAVNFQRNRWIAWKPLSGLLLFSVPFCIWSSTILLHSKTYFVLLAICLLLAGVFMIFNLSNTETEKKDIVNVWWIYPICMVIGFLSGLTGIGGGVYLAPVLLLTKWGNAKQVAAASSVFILVNSLAGLSVQYVLRGFPFNQDHIWLIFAVLAGGFIGSHLSSSIFSQKAVRLITISLIIFAAIRLLVRYL